MPLQGQQTLARIGIPELDAIIKILCINNQCNVYFSAIL